jgi:1-acyl-sn-glycerol-3-phosphate acyltransferase
MKHLHTFCVILFAIFFMLLLAPLGCVVFLLLITPLRVPALELISFVIQYVARLFLLVIGIKVKVSGEENLVRRGGVCFVSNHCGYFDIVILLAYARRPLGFIAKKELALVPFVNFWIPAIGGLFLDRKNPRKALKTMERAVKNLKHGGSMLVFPEGTRSRGRGFLPFKPGAFRLVTRSLVPVVPVAITGSYEIFEKDKCFVKCTASISFGKAIYFKDEADAKARVSEEAHKVIEDMLSRQ